MKLYHDYKKQLVKIIFLSFVGFLVLFPILFSFAQTAEELNNKISQKNTEIDKLEQEIRQYQTRLDNLGKQKKSLNISLQQLDITKKKLVADITITQKKVDKTNFKIKELSLDINDKQESITNNKEVISLGIKKIAEFEENDALITLLSESDFTSIWNDVDNILSLNDKLKGVTVQLKVIKSSLEDTKAKTTDAKNELISLKVKLDDQKKIVDQNTKEKNKLLAQTKNNEVAYQKIVAAQLAKKEALEKELEDYESKLKFILDPSTLPEKGVLSWPLENIFMTSPYGPRWGSFHRGTDFRAAVGTPIKSVADGVVKGTGDTDICCLRASFGKWILIEHNNGLSSTYAHLSLIKVTTGQKVLRGSVIAYSGNTGSSTGPHLHLSLYVSNGVKIDSFASKSYPGKTLTQPIAATTAYLDPMYYLPPYK